MQTFWGTSQSLCALKAGFIGFSNNAWRAEGVCLEWGVLSADARSGLGSKFLHMRYCYEV